MKMNMKNIILAVTSAAGGFFVSFLGGVDTVLKALLIFMAVDYITGLMVAFFFHKSTNVNYYVSLFVDISINFVDISVGFSIGFSITGN